MAFTEHGVAMLSSVLRSPRAIEVNILIVRAFIRLRELLSLDENLALKVEKLEKQMTTHGKSLQEVIHILNRLLKQPDTQKQKMGFRVKVGH